MPKRSEREMYGEAFDQNPFEDMDPEEMYRAVQWEKDPEAVWEVDAPEPMVAIGELAGLDFGEDELELWDEDDAPYLAIGRDTNVLYVVPKDEDGAPLEDIPAFDAGDDAWSEMGQVRQTDYYSDKGNEPGYYYHNHEDPFPTVWEHDSGVRVVVPADNDGKRSYAVAKEGIVG